MTMEVVFWILAAVEVFKVRVLLRFFRSACFFSNSGNRQAAEVVPQESTSSSSTSTSTTASTKLELSKRLGETLDDGG
jgi:hypothetical protein